MSLANESRLSLSRIAEAISCIDAPFLNSPQFEVEGGEPILGCRLVVKIETINPIRSFKARGAQFFTAQLPVGTHLTCATAGNFGQGMAYAARKNSSPLTVFTNTAASPLKIARMRQLGADVRLAGSDPNEVRDAARAFSLQTAAVLVEDGRDAAIAEGAGTIAIEMLRWAKPYDAVVIPVGDGALLAGIARWMKAHAPSIRIIGVCVAGAPMERSWRTGVLHKGLIHKTIADGLAVPTPFKESLTDLISLADEIVTVDDTLLLAAMRLVYRELGLALEPSGAAGIAAVLANRDHFGDMLVGTILTGGNISNEEIQRWLL